MLAVNWGVKMAGEKVANLVVCWAEMMVDLKVAMWDWTVGSLAEM